MVSYIANRIIGIVFLALAALVYFNSPSISSCPWWLLILWPVCAAGAIIIATVCFVISIIFLIIGVWQLIRGFR